MTDKITGLLVREITEKGFLPADKTNLGKKKNIAEHQELRSIPVAFNTLGTMPKGPMSCTRFLLLFIQTYSKMYKWKSVNHGMKRAYLKFLFAVALTLASANEQPLKPLCG